MFQLRLEGVNLLSHGEEPKPMNGQGSDFMKQMKEKAQHNLQMLEKSLGSLGKELGQDTWGFLGA